MPIGAKKANLSQEVQSHLEEVALNEQGHALFTRQVRRASCLMRGRACTLSSECTATGLPDEQQLQPGTCTSPAMSCHLLRASSAAASGGLRLCSPDQLHE